MNLKQNILARAEEFIWQNARLLERQRFAYHFGDGKSADVIAALRAYQNPDGGFGNALEPDLRGPHSQPAPVQHALEFLDETTFDEEMAQRACDWLMTVTTAEGGVPWLLPSALAYPRAPWWQTDEDPPASLNPTAAIAGVLHKNGFQHPWLVGATDYCWSQIAVFEPTEMHHTAAVLTFLYHVPTRARAQKELTRLTESLLASNLVADVSDSAYVRRPLDWAPTPEHPLRPYFRQEVIDANLDQLIAEQQDDGGWTIRFPATTPMCELEWRGWTTLTQLLLLRANGRLEMD